MHKRTKVIISIIGLISLALTIVGFNTFSVKRTPNEKKYIHNDTSINTNDPREVVGAKTYVFVGVVEDTYDYYTTKTLRKHPQIIHDYEMSFTECVITVVKNIKGELEENSSFSFYKVGGITEDGQAIELYENDLIPEKGKYYIFTGIAHKDGTLTGGGQNGTIELEEGVNNKTLSESTTYNAYIKAYKEQIINNTANRIEYVAKNDKRYENGEYNLELYRTQEAAINNAKFD